jgi:hypothetical protein
VISPEPFCLSFPITYLPIERNLHSMNSLIRNVARVTGESVRFIRSRGFDLVFPPRQSRRHKKSRRKSRPQSDKLTAVD